MKRIAVLMICLAPALAFGQQSYTNEDLAKFQVPGAYTNEDLKRLAPLPVQKAPAVELPEYVPSRPLGDAYQMRYDGLAGIYASLQAEIEYEYERIEFSESAFAGDTRDVEVRNGNRAWLAPLIEELRRRAAVVKTRMESVAEAARRAGATLERR